MTRRLSFDEACFKDMVKRDAFAAVLFASEAPKNQQETFKKWFREALGLKEVKKDE